jgi:hypothetical protein
MRKISLITLFLASLLLLTSQQQAVLAYRHHSTGIAFPVLLGEMKRGEVTNYEENQRGLGLGVSYSATNVAVAEPDTSTHEDGVGRCVVSANQKGTPVSHS